MLVLSLLKRAAALHKAKAASEATGEEQGCASLPGQYIAGTLKVPFKDLLQWRAEVGGLGWEWGGTEGGWGGGGGGWPRFC